MLILKDGRPMKHRSNMLIMPTSDLRQRMHLLVLHRIQISGLVEVMLDRRDRHRTKEVRKVSKTLIVKSKTHVIGFLSCF
jgi:hypothetical protein